MQEYIHDLNYLEEGELLQRMRQKYHLVLVDEKRQIHVRTKRKLYNKKPTREEIKIKKLISGIENNNLQDCLHYFDEETKEIVLKLVENRKLIETHLPIDLVKLLINRYVYNTLVGNDVQASMIKTMVSNSKLVIRYVKEISESFQKSGLEIVVKTLELTTVPNHRLYEVRFRDINSRQTFILIMALTAKDLLRIINLSEKGVIKISDSLKTELKSEYLKITLQQ